MICILFIGISVQVHSVSNDFISIVNLALAQNPDDTSIAVPSNLSKLEITLRNEADNPYPFFDSPLFVGVVSAGSAIIGGLLGSHMTNKANKEAEDRRKAEEEEKQANVRALIHENLHLSEFSLDELSEKGKVTKENIQRSVRMLDVAERLYRDVPIELKATCFDSKVLVYIQGYYDFLASTFPMLSSAISRYEDEIKGKGNESLAVTNFENALSKLGITGLKSALEEVIQKVHRAYPEESKEI